jgi:hypothetical protein
MDLLHDYLSDTAVRRIAPDLKISHDNLPQVCWKGSSPQLAMMDAMRGSITIIFTLPAQAGQWPE